MNKIIITAAAVALLATTASAKTAGDSIYVKGTVGYSTGQKIKGSGSNIVSMSQKNGKGFLGNVGAGMAFSNGLRADAELYFDGGMESKFKLKHKVLGDLAGKAKIKTVGLFLNGYFDIKNSSPLTPYVMGGLGWAHNELSLHGAGATATTKSSLKLKHKTNNLAYQAGLGVSYAVAKNVALDVGYRYIDKQYSGKTLSNTMKFKSKGIHAGVVGVRVSF